MTDTMAHRGPDDRGTWTDGLAALGHRRLAVIDLSRAGRQPMANEDGSVHIVYNGTVYNFRELADRYDLPGRGHVIRSRTDTEVLLHLYQELGVEMVRELNGMFSMGIWDARKRCLFLLRDHYGIKPLFYQRDDRCFRFASEIKALLADARVPRRVSLQAMHDFLTFDYIPGPQTAFEGIFEVPPAHWMEVAESDAITLRRYWDLPFSAARPMDESWVVEHSLELMERAVHRRLVADVPIGVLLSGGMDSSALVALMKVRVSEPIRTYAVGFEESSFDERKAGRTVAQHFGTVHREVVVTPQLVRDLLPGYLRYIDEPYSDGSAIPTYYAAALAKEEVVVLLSGEGGMKPSADRIPIRRSRPPGSSSESRAGFETGSSDHSWTGFRSPTTSSASSFASSGSLVDRASTPQTPISGGGSYSPICRSIPSTRLRCRTPSCRSLQGDTSGRCSSDPVPRTSWAVSCTSIPPCSCRTT